MGSSMTPLRLLAPLLALLMFDVSVYAQTAYKSPPKAVTDILDAPAFPTVSVSPARDYIALVQSERYPPIAELAEPILRLAGVRINPRTNGPARAPRVTAITLKSLDGK